MSLTIWAYCRGAFQPGNGWDNVISLPLVDNLSYLMQSLATMGASGRVSRLALVAHGSGPGVIHSDPIMDQVSMFRDPRVAGRVAGRRDYLEPSAQVLLMSCIAGAGPQGSSFLRALSTFWPGRTVIGFITSGEINPYHFQSLSLYRWRCVRYWRRICGRHGPRQAAKSRTPQ